MAHEVMRDKRYLARLQNTISRARLVTSENAFIFAKPCAFCMREEHNDEINFGKLYSIGDIQCHYFCCLLSCCLIQKGQDDEGLLGFMYPDILAEIERSKKHKCSYCNRNGASLGCAVSSCRKQFHLPCGREKNAISLYFGTYKSYCQQHVPKQRIPEHIMANAKLRMKMAKNKGTAKTNVLSLKNDGINHDELEETVCVICYEAVDGYPTVNTFWPPCCARDAWFHRTCLQRMALSAGMHYLKCPLCNDKEQFYQAVVDQGYYVPDRDAAWELEQNAFAEIYERPVTCGSELCFCPMGREHDSEYGEWDIKLCLLCGSAGAHAHCMIQSKKSQTPNPINPPHEPINPSHEPINPPQELNNPVNEPHNESNNPITQSQRWDDISSKYFVCKCCMPAAPEDLAALASKIEALIQREQVANAANARRPVMPSRMSIRRTKGRIDLPSSSATNSKKTENLSQVSSNVQASRLELNLKSPKKMAQEPNVISRHDNKILSPFKLLEQSFKEKVVCMGVRDAVLDESIIENLRKKFRKPRPLSQKKKIVNDILDGLFDDLLNNVTKEKEQIREWCTPKKEQRNDENLSKYDENSVKCDKKITEDFQTLPKDDENPSKVDEHSSSDESSSKDNESSSKRNNDENLSLVDKHSSTASSNVQASRLELILKSPKKMAQEPNVILRYDNKIRSPSKLREQSSKEKVVCMRVRDAVSGEKITEKLSVKPKKPRPLSQKKKIVNDILDGLFDDAINNVSKEKEQIRKLSQVDEHSSSVNENSSKNNESSSSHDEKLSKDKGKYVRNEKIIIRYDTVLPKVDDNSVKVNKNSLKVDEKSSKRDEFLSKNRSTRTKTKKRKTKSKRRKPTEKITLKIPKETEPEFSEKVKENSIIETPKRKTIDTLQNSSLEISENNQIVNIDVIKLEQTQDSYKKLNIKLPEGNCTFFKNKQMLKHVFDMENFEKNYLNEVNRKQILAEKSNTNYSMSFESALNSANKYYEKQKPIKKEKSRKRKLSNSLDNVGVVKKRKEDDSKIRDENTIISEKAKTYRSEKERRKRKIKKTKNKKNIKLTIDSQNRTGKNKIKTKFNINSDIKVKIKWKKKQFSLNIASNGQAEKKKKLSKKKDKSPKLKQYVLQFTEGTSKEVLVKPEKDVDQLKRKYIKHEKSPDKLRQMSIQNFFKVKSPMESKKSK